MALRTNGFWGTVSPDYDDPDVVAAFVNFINAFAARYDDDPRAGFMSLGLVGLWGEWHTWPYDRDLADGYPNLMPSDTTIRTLINAYDAAFDNLQLEVRYPRSGGGGVGCGDRVPRRLVAVQGVARQPAQEHDAARAR